MKETAKVLKKLITTGAINDRMDEELFNYANQKNVCDELNDLAEEWSFYILRTTHDIYLLPLQDNEMFNARLRDIRENAGTAARNIDAYLQCYITMIIIWMFFRSKNGIPQGESSLRIKDIVEMLDERLSSSEESEAMEDKQISFKKIADIWNNKAVLNEGRKSSKVELVKTACRFLVSNKLVEFHDDEDEIRPKRKFLDIMLYYYLNESRIAEINSLFEKEDLNADN